jgi:hypothetical protein
MRPPKDRIEVIATLETRDRDAEYLVGAINRALEIEILRNPAEWLMWPALDLRSAMAPED